MKPAFGMWSPPWHAKGLPWRRFRGNGRAVFQATEFTGLVYKIAIGKSRDLHGGHAACSARRNLRAPVPRHPRRRRISVPAQVDEFSSRITAVPGTCRMVRFVHSVLAEQPVMEDTMNTGFLGEEDVAEVREIMRAHGIDDFGASVRLWGRNKAIQVDGPLTLAQIRCLLDIATYLQGDLQRIHSNLQKAA
ncbi:MAG TPA: hypothetical protein VJM11_04940 [Nevskiaceae bacterium]|nr:hypothetical protein [Nevskiaceae bacterium]